MKHTAIKSLLVLLALLYIQSAVAGISTYSASVTAEKGGIVNQTHVAAPSYHACEIQKSDVINNYIAAGFTILNATSCTPLYFRLPELMHPEWKIRWPIPPVCLSCPPWDISILEVFDPFLAKQVHELTQKYRVNEYLKELHILQEKFDLEGFDKALEELDVQQQQFR
ncbi:hypothetical protein [Nitrosomonas aestuarii]|uniref:hypothetical protein n=1 Tax=Nitrosomonas aestuarii TaxID=52441 RepID=UPI000D419179|nr:hypothetical protein [Nitrosomonas aestuarii]PTN12141.1 hypothetical protein C8R11_105103 [Nitrosomonas aestuarii]